MSTAMQRAYGKKATQIAADLEIKLGVVYRLAREEKLADAISAGKYEKSKTAFEQEYGANAGQIAEKYNVPIYAVYLASAKGTLHEKINKGWPKSQTVFEKKYGMTTKEAARKLSRSMSHISCLASEGRLSEALQLGYVPDRRSSTYVDLYGQSAQQLAKELKVGYSTIIAWHGRGILKKIVEGGSRPLGHNIYPSQYGLSKQAAARKLNCSEVEVATLHKFGFLQQALKKRGIKIKKVAK